MFGIKSPSSQIDISFVPKEFLDLSVSKWRLWAIILQQGVTTLIAHLLHYFRLNICGNWNYSELALGSVDLVLGWVLHLYKAANHVLDKRGFKFGVAWLRLLVIDPLNEVDSLLSVLG